MVSGTRTTPVVQVGPEPAVHRGGLKPRHIDRLLREQLTTELQAILKSCGEVGRALNVPVFAVGGFVRDLLLHQHNLDMDIVVEGDGIVFAEELVRLV